MVVLLISAVLAGCSSGGQDSATDLASTPTEPVPSTALTTTTPPATSTTTTTMSADRWFETRVLPMVDEYNDQFGGPYQEHVNDLDYRAAELDCVEVRPLVDGWRDDVLPSPDPQADALMVRFFDVLSENLDACAEGGTLGEWRVVNQGFESLAEILDRVLDRVGSS